LADAGGTEAQLQEPTIADALLELARKHGGQLFAILDAARSDEILQRLAQYDGTSESLFQGKGTEKYFAVSPILVDCESESDLFSWLTTEAWGQSCGVFLASSASFTDLLKHLRGLLTARTEDGTEVFFRFYDPRVLRVFLPTCTKKEREAFFGPVECFVAEPESGELVLEFGKTGN
jgi:hypothetical protein